MKKDIYTYIAHAYGFLKKKLGSFESRTYAKEQELFPKKKKKIPLPDKHKRESRIMERVGRRGCYRGSILKKKKGYISSSHRTYR